jgi:L-serine dehydratase
MEYSEIIDLAHKKKIDLSSLTIDDCIELANAAECRVSDVIIAETIASSNLQYEAVADKILAAYRHNLKAAEVGADTGKSFIMGTVGKELAGSDSPRLIDDEFINKILVYTLATQVGNHEIGVQPCAGTGDSCPYTGFMRAVIDSGADKATQVRIAAVLSKIGSLYRVAKTSTGCNLEGFGAGAPALAAAFVELEGGTPTQLGHAMTLAISPTISVPCTPRVMVPALCATHIGGAVLVACLASHLAMRTHTLNVTVPVDVMMAMAAAVHPLSAKHVVPEVNRYMQPFFKTHPGVEVFIDPKVKEEEQSRIHAILEQAKAETRALAAKSRSILDPFGLAVVGGSSQAVGSPTNTGRIAHALAKRQGLAKPSKVLIELYPELFLRRGINIPGILMAALYGSDTSDGATYRVVMDRVAAEHIAVDICMVSDTPQLQKVTVFYENGKVMVAALNRGGARLVLLESSAGLDAAREAAAALGIEVVE